MTKLPQEAKEYIELHMGTSNRILALNIGHKFNIKTTHTTVGKEKKEILERMERKVERVEEKKAIKPVIQPIRPRKSSQYRLVKETDLEQLVIDINQERITVPEYVKHYFQNNTTDAGVFRGKRDQRKGGRIDATLKRLIHALVDSEFLYIKR